MKKPWLKASDPDLLARAERVARAYAGERIADGTLGVVFLGGLARGYFDQDADIDIAVFRKNGPEETRVSCESVEGFEVQTFLSDYDAEMARDWEMGKRWAFSESIMFYDKEGRTGKLLDAKVPLGEEERLSMMKSGITLSEWHCNRLPGLWLRRGSPLSAHSMFNEGLNHYLSALYALNRELVADHKWRLFRALALPILPADFETGIQGVLEMRDASEEDLERRRASFMALWNETLPWIEKEAGMAYEDFKDTI
jgi:hypothetical protein